MRKKKMGSNRIYSRARKKGVRVSGAKPKKIIKTKYKKILVASIVIVALVFCGKLYLMQRAELKTLVNQKNELENEIITIQEETRDLHQEVAKLDDPAYIEKVARSEYGMVGKDDIIFVPARTSKER